MNFFSFHSDGKVISLNLETVTSIHWEGWGVVFRTTNNEIFSCINDKDMEELKEMLPAAAIRLVETK